MDEAIIQVSIIDMQGRVVLENSWNASNTTLIGEELQAGWSCNKKLDNKLSD
jgi:hypothetical protein